MKLFEKLVKVYNEIDKIYREMYTIECNHQKNSLLFNKKIEDLKIKLLEENNLFCEFVKSAEYDEIKEELDLYAGEENFFLRMREHVIMHDVMKNNSYNEETEIGVLVGKIYDCSSKNLFLLYATFFDFAIDNLKSGDIRNNLLKIKYYSCIVKYNLEKVLVQNNFNIPEELYIDLNLVIDLMKIDENISESIILDSYMTAVSDAIQNLMVNTDEEYMYDDFLIAVKINYQCLLKAAFALMSEYEFCLLRNNIINLLDDLMNDMNLVTRDGILDIMDNRQDYRSGVKKLSLKPIKS